MVNVKIFFQFVLEKKISSNFIDLASNSCKKLVFFKEKLTHLSNLQAPGYGIRPIQASGHEVSFDCFFYQISGKKFRGIFLGLH